MLDKNEIDKLIKEIVSKNKTYSDIQFTDYCKAKMEQRNVEKNAVITCLLSSTPYYAERQEISIKNIIEVRHKLIYKISSKYSLIIIILYSENVLKVINVIKTSKSAEKLWRKKILK